MVIRGPNEFLEGEVKGKVYSISNGGITASLCSSVSSEARYTLNNQPVKV